MIPIAEDASKESEETKEKTCFRKTLVCLSLPLLGLLSLAGAIIWLLLLPLKLIPCLCPLACTLQVLWDAIEWMLKAPLRACSEL